eukprot:CAMPEP_0178397546 /NCGR_PEP_ID=MMETSP0689_2-20121128/14303_1 /TAXON_ID=160604 /ORGANISM="Amphidinium massartii, Strain CS-259" /LENGTH=215 /DNA_ID=CAMNT_0020018261 /DNA_START=82 /DNA_END=726 /DNA_ORIENTATION=+
MALVYSLPMEDAARGLPALACSYHPIDTKGKQLTGVNTFNNNNTASGNNSNSNNAEAGRVVAQTYDELAPKHRDQNFIPSIGSMQHESGSCTPCVFANSPTVGCRKGPFCNFCHYRHRISSEKRLPKAKREQLRKFINNLTEEIEKDPDYLEKNQVQIPASLEKNPALLRSIVKRLEELSANSSKSLKCWEPKFESVGTQVDGHGGFVQGVSTVW